MFTAFFAVQNYLTVLPFAKACGDTTGFFSIPPWYKYLTVTGTSPECHVAFNVPESFLAVGLAILDMLLRLAGMVAVISIIIAGIGYITAGGDAQKAATARRRIINSLVGLSIALVATGVVTFIGYQLGP